MTSLPASLARAFAQLADPRILWLLIKSLLVTLLLFVLLGVGVYFGLMWLVDRGLGAGLSENLPPDFAEVLATIGTLAAIVFGGWLLFRVTALAAIQFFADDVVEVVEAKYYPEALENARRIGFAESMWLSFKGAVRVVFVNILILPLALVLLVTGVGTVVLFALVNAWLLGRELRDMAWLRHRHDRKEEPPIVIDMASCSAAYGKIEIALRKGAGIPQGWAIDGQGKDTLAPAKMIEEGALLPLGSDRERGGHKGYGLAIMVDVLSCVLSGANWGPFAPPFALRQEIPDKQVGKGIGHFFGSMRIDAFIDPDEFKSQIDAYRREMQSARPAPGTDGPLIPGDPELEAEKIRSKEGIPLLPAVVEDLRDISRHTGVPFD